MSPTARSLALLRKRGWTAQVVEKRVWKVTLDLFGCIDILGVKGSEMVGCLGVQATTQAHAADRVAKSIAEPRLVEWLHAGNRFEVWGWRQVGARGKRKTWQVLVRRITIADLDLSVETLKRLDEERRTMLGTAVVPRGFLLGDEHHHGD